MAGGDFASPQASDSIAPRWHTATLIVWMLAVATTGTWMRLGAHSTAAPAAASPRTIAIYLPMLAVQWGLAFYVCRLGRARNALPTLLGVVPTTLRRWAADVAIALSGWVLICAFEVAWARTFATTSGAAVAAMLPRSATERLVWLLVAMSVGFCEEIVFRGYLQTQLAAFTRRATVAIVLQAVLFGVAHGEQGAGAVVRCTIYGLGFGALARWRRSLVPGIVCHVWTDVASGLAAR